MSSFVKRFVGLIVGKIALTAQVIPITQTDIFKKLNAWFFYPTAKRKKLINAWDSFVELNQTKGPEEFLNVKRNPIQVKPGVVLDTIEMHYPMHQDTQKYIIYAWGRSDCYEKKIYRLATDALNLNARIISFNYRGVGFSTGEPYSEDDVVEDLYFQAKRLIDQGVSPQKIYLHGHSLGGGISILALDRLRREGYPCKISNDRSFKHLVQVSVGVNFENKKLRWWITKFFTLVLLTPALFALTYFGWLGVLQAGGLLAMTYCSFYFDKTYRFWDHLITDTLNTCMVGLMHYGKWIMDVAPIFESFPEEDKQYMTLLPPREAYSVFGLGEKYGHDLLGDHVIYDHYQLHSGLDGTLSRVEVLRKELVDAYENISEDTIDKIRSLQAELIQLSNVKFTGGSHGSMPKTLLTRYKDPHANRHLTAQEVYYGFVEPESGHTEVEPKVYKQFQH